jgi:hypothetical protein
MGMEEFSTCANNELNFAYDSWEAVAQGMVEMYNYLESNWWTKRALELAEEYGGEAVAEALAALAVAVGASAEVVAACIAIAAAAGVSIGTVLWVVGNCASQLG